MNSQFDKMKNSSITFCYYCNSPINISEYQKVDFELSCINSEDQEYLLDYLNSSKSSKKPLIEQYFHLSNDGSKIINVCIKCYSEAFHSVFNEGGKYNN